MNTPATAWIIPFILPTPQVNAFIKNKNAVQTENGLNSVFWSAAKFEAILFQAVLNCRQLL